MIICLYSNNFEIRQIPATNQHFSCEKSLLLCGSRFLKSSHQFLWFEIFLPQASKYKETYFATRKTLQNCKGHDHWHCHNITFWVMDKIMSKYGHLMLPGAFPDKVTLNIDFIDEAVIQCYDVPVVKILLQVLVISEWPQVNFDVNTYGPLGSVSGPSFMYSFSFLRSWSI